MKKTIIHASIALLLGALSLYMFFALFGVFAAFSTEHRLYSWVLSLPKSLRQTGFLFHRGLEDFAIALPIMGFAGLIVGIIVTKRPILFGFIQFIGAMIFYFVYEYIVFDNQFIWIDSIPVWSQILPFVTWMCIFMCAVLFGNKKLKSHFISVR